MRKNRYIVEDNELMAYIRLNEQWAINHIYVKYLKDIYLYLRANGADHDICMTCYHDTMLIFIDHVRQGRLNNNEGSILPYIKRVARVTWLKESRRPKHGKAFLDYFNPNEPAGSDGMQRIIEEETRSGRLEILWKVFENLNERCKQIIEHSYLFDPPYSGAEIAELLEYRDANVVRVTRFRCMNMLRAQFFELYNHNQLS